MHYEVTPSIQEGPSSELAGYPYAFGRLAVNLAIRQCEGVYGCHPDICAEISSTTQDFINAELEKARRQLEGLGDDDRAKAAELLELESMPAGLRVMVSNSGKAGTDVSVFDRLLSRGGGRVPNETFLNILEWHNYKLGQRQREFNRTEAPEQKIRFFDAVEKAVAAGWLPPEALNNAQDRLPRTGILLDDGFMTCISSRSRGSMALNSCDYDYRVLLGPNMLGHTFLHELSHIIAGEDDDYAQKNGKSQLRGLERIFGDNPGSTLIDEAVTEHVALSLDLGELEVLKPQEQQNGGRSYLDGAYLLMALCSMGIKPVRVQRFIDAYCENGATRDALGENSASERLLADLREAYPEIDIVKAVGQILPEQDRGMFSSVFALASILAILRADRAKKPGAVARIKPEIV